MKKKAFLGCCSLLLLTFGGLGLPPSAAAEESLPDQRERLVARFAQAVKAKPLNIVQARDLTEEEIEAHGLVAMLGPAAEKIRKAGYRVHFYEVEASLRPIARFIVIPERTIPRAPERDNRGLIFHTEDGERWLMVVSRVKRRLGTEENPDQLAILKIKDPDFGMLKLDDNWLKVDGAAFFEDLKRLESATEGESLKTSLGEAVQAVVGSR